MTKFLDLTIRIDHKDRYKNAADINFRDIKPTSLEIKDQNREIVSELNTTVFSSRFFVSDIKNIRVAFADLDIPISWAWENKNGGEIEFTLKNLKYDEMRGLRFGNRGVIL